MRPFSLHALTLQMGLEAGVVDRAEILSWADEMLKKHPYDDDIANLALSHSASDKELCALLGKVIDFRDELTAMRLVAARIHSELVRTPAAAVEFTGFLEAFSGRHIDSLPSEMEFMLGVDDVFQLARQGVYSTVEHETKELMGNLASIPMQGEQSVPPKSDRAGG